MKIKLIKVIQPYHGVYEHVVHMTVTVPMMPGPGVILKGLTFEEEVKRTIIDTVLQTVLCETEADDSVVYKREGDESKGRAMDEADRMQRDIDLEDRIKHYTDNGWQYAKVAPEDAE